MTCTRISRDVYILAAEFNALVAGHERDSHDEYDSFVQSLWQGLRAEKPEHSTLTERDLLSKLSHHPDLVKNCTIEGMTAVISVFFALKTLSTFVSICYVTTKECWEDQVRAPLRST